MAGRLSSFTGRGAERGIPVSLTFLDPPFNQGKDYAYFDDDQPESIY
ncbi:MAG: hypothetical protein ACUVSV_04485 [Armatimonadota bacterium]